MNFLLLKKTVIALAAVGAAITTAPARARAGTDPASEGQVSRAADDQSSAPAFELSLKAGGHFPQLTNKLGTNFDAILKFGYGVAVDRRLQLFIDLGYSQPAHDTSATDPRLGMAGAMYQSTVTVRALSTTVGGQFFFLPMNSFLLPYGGLGLQLHFVKSTVTGSGGNAFGDNDETSTQIGGAAFGGLGLHLGPGLLLGELRFGYAGIGQKVTGDANIGALSVLLGYGLLL
ncbi:MAG TPA: hypothetical protein VNO55_30065 [Polyangia bacterium]|nr:hypothetical protein [Polyangia bacterium]